MLCMVLMVKTLVCGTRNTSSILVAHPIIKSRQIGKATAL